MIVSLADLPAGDRVSIQQYYYMSYMGNQLHLSLLFWAMDYQRIFMIPDKYFHIYCILYQSWKISILVVIKDYTGYW